MKQSWWHAREASAGLHGKSGVPSWEHAYAVAEYLSRNKADPWQGAMGLSALSPVESWKWNRALLVSLGAEIGLIPTTGALLGASVVAYDESIRLLEAAKGNLELNLNETRTVGMRKAMWGAPLDLKRTTGFKEADAVIVNHGSCDAMVLKGMLQTAVSCCGAHTLILAAFQGPICKAFKALKQIFEMKIVVEDTQVSGLANTVSLVAMKLKPDSKINLPVDGSKQVT